MAFGTRLKELRESKGMNQKQLSQLAGVGQNTISNLEAGKRQPAWKIVVALANALGVSTDAFKDDAEPDADDEKRGRGRPSKPDAEPEPAAEQPKKPRGRPKKGE